MPSILFICTANRFRSPLASIYFARKVVQQGDDQDIQTSSAGTWAKTGQPAMPDAIQLAETHQLDLNFHKSRDLNGEILTESDLILVMEAGHKEAIIHEFPECKNRVFLLTEAVGEPPIDVPDPYFTSEPAEVVAAEIINIIDQGYQKIIDLVYQTFGARSNTA
ncbi:MAG: hypothetical protein U9R53_00295 [Chloroflexota bacterium]|nr:hypothetical protein [Chloroflexota bacterium]